jgi:hypothetical protein
MREWIYWLIVLLPAAVVIPGCDLPFERGPQPTELVDLEFQPGHNILGILRLDDIAGSSFIRVERAYRTEEMDEDFSSLVRDAYVMIESGSMKSIFRLAVDSVLGDVYKNSEFIATENQRYTLYISSPDLPDLGASVIVPPRPDVVEASVLKTDRSVQFDIQTNPAIQIYDIFGVLNGKFHNVRLLNDRDTLHVLFKSEDPLSSPVRIEIYGFEENLSLYMASSITIKPQAYHETVSTVEGGYGCFGALSKTTLTFE